MKVADYKVANQYGKWCGRFTAKGRSFDGSEVRYHRVNCKCWDCAYCGPRKAGAYKNRIRELAEHHKLTRFVTLTLDPKKLGGDASDSVAYLRKCFDKFRTYLQRKFGRSIKYIAVLEFQKNGFAHLHLLVDRFIEQAWISQAWEALGGGSHVDIRMVDLHRVSRYLSKYLTKDLLMSAPKKSRRLTCSRGIQLLEKLGRRHKWTLLKESIRWVFGRRCAVAHDVELDRNDQLLSFVVPKLSGKSLRFGSPGFGWWQTNL